MASREYRERLIDEVRKYPVLYDTRHESHRDIDARDRCWTEISERLGANSEVLKREWKILRDSLRQAIKKKKSGATTRAGAPCKRWRFQSRMAFVLPYMTRRHQRPMIKDDIKVDVEPEAQSDQEETEAWEPAGAEAGAERDSLELFFASVCCSARRLPGRLQGRLKKQVLDALLAAEEEAEGGERAERAERGDTKSSVYNSF